MLKVRVGRFVAKVNFPLVIPLYIYFNNINILLHSGVYSKRLRG